MDGIIFNSAVMSVLGTAGFAVLLKVPLRTFPVAIIGGVISTVVQMYFDSSGALLSAMYAMSAIGLYSEITARLLKTPSTVILTPSSIPLLPGSSIYYAMSNIVFLNKEQFSYFAFSTIKTALGMALGALITSVAVQIISHIKFKGR